MAVDTLGSLPENALVSITTPFHEAVLPGNCPSATMKVVTAVVAMVAP